VAVAGRVLTKRVMGKLAFVTLRDDSGTIQLYVDKSRLQGGAGDMKLLKSLVDAGDFLGVRGGLKRTERGELSVTAESIEVCSIPCDDSSGSSWAFALTPPCLTFMLKHSCSRCHHSLCGQSQRVIVMAPLSEPASV
jgi:aspartyl/asparaginyl-tRNA synthetase